VEGLLSHGSMSPWCHQSIAPVVATIASVEPVHLLAAESRRLMLVVVHPHRPSDSASSVFLRLTMYADPLAERVWSRLGGTHTSHSGTVGARPRKPLSNTPGIASVGEKKERKRSCGRNWRSWRRMDHTKAVRTPFPLCSRVHTTVGRLSRLWWSLSLMIWGWPFWPSS